MTKRKNGKSIRQIGRDWAARQPAHIRVLFRRVKPWHVYRVQGGPMLACVVGFSQFEGEVTAMARVHAYDINGGSMHAYADPSKLIRIHGSAMEFHNAAYRRRLLVDAVSRDAARFGMIPKGTKLTEEMVFDSSHRITPTTQENPGA